jgi:hypothetical protein
MENAKACASAALRDGEKSLKCIGFLDGKGAIRQVVKNQAFAIVKCIKWKVFAPSNCTKWKISDKKKRTPRWCPLWG